MTGQGHLDWTRRAPRNAAHHVGAQTKRVPTCSRLHRPFPPLSLETTRLAEQSAQSTPANRSASRPVAPSRGPSDPLTRVKYSVPKAFWPTLLDSAKNGPSTA